jgi:hypothetical protein
MNERNIIKIIAGLLAAVLAIAIGGTDALYPVVALLFFGLCIAYAEWCERL